MKRTIGVMVGSLVAALALVAMLIPKATPLIEDVDDPYWQMWREVGVARADARTVRELYWRAEARATARAFPVPAKPEIIVRFDPSIGTVARERLKQAFEAEVRDAARGPLKSSVALVVGVDTQMRNAVYRQSTVQPEGPGEPCMVLIRATGPHIERLAIEPTRRLLGTCGFYAAFGEPGPPIKQWLRDTRAFAARFLRVPAAFAGDSAPIDLARARSYYALLEVDVYGCRAGRAAACDRVASPDPVARLQLEGDGPVRAGRVEELAHYEPGVSVLASGVRGSSLVQQALLAKLAEELGNDRFGEVWRGTGSLEEAYVAETGRTLTEWTSDYVASRTTPYHAGPGVPLLSTLMALAITIALATWTLARASRAMT